MLSEPFYSILPYFNSMLQSCFTINWHKLPQYLKWNFKLLNYLLSFSIHQFLHGVWTLFQCLTKKMNVTMRISWVVVLFSWMFFCIYCLFHSSLLIESIGKFALWKQFIIQNFILNLKFLPTSTLHSIKTFDVFL